MNKTLEGMARASVDADGCDGDYDKNPPEIREALATDMKHALLWLAANVSDEMSIAAVVDWQNNKGAGTLQDWLQSAISAALRAAGDGR